MKWYVGLAEKVFRGGRVWGFNHFQVVNYLSFRKKVPNSPPPPDPSKGWHFLISKKPKDIIQQGF
ncbi:MAG: hypothetical protein EWV76_02350 [Microcystis novacekii Mn_MB_F_20050700_S1]|uniref:Uncharacterized protein n=1 Tax=Microcystis novacekii Mn_MB_F_20050700_S1D TaxID=2486266 RepID=A0A552IXE5_9CHRO|nr:MAG: hypothetical protein EWV54_11005 [Microcystis novacekii Mn_MB_F_20050700_S1D]TRU92341.1 MAG: hypothetical protein EWV76_02350 [Microcystis novacekii Mn_MB_F_20050700_S1]